MPLPIQQPDIRIKLEDEERARLGKDLIAKIERARAGMKNMLDKVKEHERYYESDLPAKTFPWDDCSNLNLPTIQSHVDTIHANVNNVVLGISPVTRITVPSYVSNPDAKSAAGRVEAAVGHVEREMMRIEEVGDQWNLTSLMQPAGIVKIPWREEYRAVVRMIQDELTGEIVTEDSEELKYRGPKMELVDIENFVIYPLSVASKEEATIIGDRFKLSSDEIRRRVNRGTFDNKPTEDILLLPESEDSSRASSEQKEDLEISGLEMTDAEEYWFWEVIAPYDANGDGIAEDCVFTLDAVNGVVVRATKFPYFHGIRYYVLQTPYRKARNRWLGRTVPGILEGMQEEGNAVHNQRVDATTLAMCKAFKYLKSSGLIPDDVQIHPGAAVALENMTDLEELDISPQVPGVELEAINQDMSEKASGVSDLTLGRETETKKTLGEIQIASAKGGVRFGDIVRRVQTAYSEVARQVAGLMYQFMDDEELMELGLESREELIAPWKYEGHGDQGTADEGRQREEALLLYDKLVSGPQPNPLIVSDPLRLYRMTQDVLQAFGRRDVENYIGTEEALKQQMEMAQQQAAMQEEAMMQAQAQQMAMEQGMEGRKMDMEEAKMMQQAEDAEANRQNQLMLAQMKAQQGASRATK